MKRLFTAAWIVFLFTFYITGQDYHLAWEDNFDGDSLNPETWNIEEKTGIWNTGQNAELQFYITENIRVGDDGSGNNCLIIKALRESYNNYSFTSGRVNTNSKMSFRFGKLEARIRIPDLENGLWPAFWTEGYSTLPWPDKGEIDIMEMGFSDAIALDTVNSWLGAATHWEYAGNRADYGNHIIYGSRLSDDYHIFTLEWTPTYIKTWLDGDQQVFSFSLGGTDLEEYKDISHFIILNLAVGGILPGITNSGEISVPFPAEMYIDYIKLYQKEGQENFVSGPHRIEGPFGVYSESGAGVYMNSEFDSEITSSGLASFSTSPYEGYQSLAYSIQSGQEFSLEIKSQTDRNLTAFSEGAINFYLKTGYTGDIELSIEDQGGGRASLVIDDSKVYNPDRNNSWNLVSVPLSDFSGEIDFSRIRTPFSLASSNLGGETNFELDKIIWTEEYSGPVEANYYGVFADHEGITEKLDFGSMGHIYVWNGFSGLSGLPYYGRNYLAFKANTSTWNGFGIHSDVPVDLSEFIGGYLNFAFKTTGSTEFTIGFKNLQEHSWEYKFPAGSQNAGLKRDGVYHIISIPLSSLVPAGGSPALTANLLSQVTIPFYLVGTITFSIDEIYFSKDISTLYFGIEGIQKNIPEELISLFPIPAGSFLYSEGIKGSARVSIFTSEGRLLREFNSPGDFQHEVSDLAPGVYFIKIRGKDAEISKAFTIR